VKKTKREEQRKIKNVKEVSIAATINLKILSLLLFFRRPTITSALSAIGDTAMAAHIRNAFVACDPSQTTDANFPMYTKAYLIFE
jgi:hypothetical protein